MKKVKLGSKSSGDRYHRLPTSPKGYETQMINLKQAPERVTSKFYQNQCHAHKWLDLEPKRWTKDMGYLKQMIKQQSFTGKPIMSIDDHLLEECSLNMRYDDNESKILMN